MLLTGDIIQVVADRRFVSFMYSYPNYVPLNSSAVHRILDSVAPFSYDRLYGAFWDSVISNHAAQSLQCSADRYLQALSDPT